MPGESGLGGARQGCQIQDSKSLGTAWLAWRGGAWSGKELLPKHKNTAAWLVSERRVDAVPVPARLGKGVFLSQEAWHEDIESGGTDSRLRPIPS